MGVHGLWKLLEPAGKPVALETLQNKILGVDVSIWLYQLLKGFQDRRGSPLPNAHLLGIFHRVCKLLFYRIKPVFVFDGGVPILKKNTIAARRKLKGRAARDAEKLTEQLLKNLVKHKAVRKVLGEKAGRNVVTDDRPRKDDNLFELPPMLNDLNEFVSLSSDSEASVKYEPSAEESDSEQEAKYLSPSKAFTMNLDLHTLDVKSETFRSLPADVRHDILSDLKETRKQNSWGRIHEMPKESTDFSSFQLDRLLKRRNVQVSLEEAEKEMGGKVLSMAELQDLMNAQGVKLEDETGPSKETQLNTFSRRIASDVATRFLLISESVKASDSKKDDSTAVSNDAKVEVKKGKDVKEDKLGGKETIKQEYQDDWSSDEGIEKIEKVKINEIKIKEEFPDDWTSDDESKNLGKVDNLGQFFSEKDILSQAEILAIIEDEKKKDSKLPALPDKSKHSHDIPENTAVVPSTSKSTEQSCVSVKSDSDSDFDEVLPNEPTIKIEKKSPVKSVAYSKKSKVKEIEVVIDTQAYKPQDDIFADIFPTSKNGSEAAEVTTTHDQKIGKSKSKHIEVLVDTQSYKPEDDIFADIIPADKSYKPTNAVKMVRSPDKDVNEILKTEIKVAIKKTHSYKPKDDMFADVFLTVSPKKVVDKEKADKYVSAEKEKLGIPQKEFEAGFSEETDSHVDDHLDDNASEKAASISGTVDKSAGDDQEENEEGRKSDEENSSLTIAPAVSQMFSEKLQSLESALEEKHDQLLAEKGRQERLAASITDQMCSEAQELLRLFGVPYITAPMEAEAQCAFLDALSLTEGTITDDSDIWLFGGRKVYKNFFNQKKHVLQYTSATIQHYLKLDRNHLVLLALLVGSDYTNGLQGIGPVTAMEVLAAFSPGKVESESDNRNAMLEGLRRFRDWCKAGRPQRSAATQLLRNKVKDVQFYEGFPSLAVMDAYLRPAVDESREAFTWGDMDLQGLREFARIKFGWAQAKADEILLPVAKRVAERQSQRFIDSYFNVMPQFKEGDKKISKRVKRAVRRIHNEDGSESEEVEQQHHQKTPPKRSTQRKRSASRDGEAINEKKLRTNEENSDDHNMEEVPLVPRRAAKPRQIPSSVPSKSATKRSVEEGNNENDNSSDEDDPTPMPKKIRTQGKTKLPQNNTLDDECEKKSVASKQVNQVPKIAKPRQRTSTGVIRTGVQGQPKKIVSKIYPEKETADALQKSFASETSKNIVNAEVKPSHPWKKPATTERKPSQPRKELTNTERKPSQKRPRVSKHRSSFDAVCEEEYEVDDPQEISDSQGFKKVEPTINTCKSYESNLYDDPKPGTSKELDKPRPVISKYNDEPKSGSSRSNNDSQIPFNPDCDEPDEEEEALLAALHAMDWGEDPLEGFEPAREKLFFGGVRKNSTSKPRQPPVPAVSPPPSSSQPRDIRGYRPGARTLERIQSRTTHPHFEWKSPAANIPQKEKDRQQLEENKMKAIKLFKAVGAAKATKLLGEDPASSKRKIKKRKPVAKVTQLNLSEDSSSD